MPNVNEVDDRVTKRIRWIARIWGSVIIAVTLFILIGYTWNWVTTGQADPYAVEDYPPIENFPALFTLLSVIGLGIAWRWEGLGGAIAVLFRLAELPVLLVHWPITYDFPRYLLAPYGTWLVIAVPGSLFLMYWWRSKQRTALKEFSNWFGRILKKWWMWLGFLPLLLDWVSAYIPAEYIPTSIRNLLEVGANWQLTLILVTIGMLVSAFLVHLEDKAKLSAYEYQAPEYELKEREITGDLCRSGCHVEVRCCFGIMGTNAFKGQLKHITVSGAGQIGGLGPWEIRSAVYGRSRSRLPVTVSNSKSDLIVIVQAEVDKEMLKSDFRVEWETAEFSLHLMTEYFTQPVGYVQKPLLVNIPIDLGEQFDALVAHYAERSA